jgi:adenylate kinase
VSVTTGKYSSPANQEASSDGMMLSHMYSENEYPQRKAIPAYQGMKNLENLVLTANKMNTILKTYVLCSGITYGNGEETLYKHFNTAYQSKDDLKLYGDGKNVIPMIHVNDLATYVKVLVYKRPADIEYILALDHAKTRTQGAIVRAISNGMGSVPVKNLGLMDAVFEPDFNIMTMNIPVIPSNLLSLTAEENGEEADSKAGEFSFNWQYREGFVENFDKIYQEFKIFRRAKTIKIFVTGAPGVGKIFHL